jgi:hypothetical protein
MGSGVWPYKGSLANIDILRGPCVTDTYDTYCLNTLEEEGYARLNVRCKQSQTDSVFMFLTVVVLFGTFTLTFLRMRKNA